MNAGWIIPFIIFGGALQSCGAAMNGQLNKSLGNPWLASAVSFALITFFFTAAFFVMPQLLADVTLFTVAEDIVQSGSNDVESAVQVLRLDGSHGEAFVEALKELRQEPVAGLHVADAGKSQFLDQTVLEGTVDSLHAALGLAGVRADDLDVQLCQRTAELRHTRTSLSVRLVHAENRVLVRVKGYGAAVGFKITLQCFEVGVRALAGHEAQLHQSARRVIDQDQQRAGCAAVLEPTMLAAVDLDQLASQVGLHWGVQSFE